jgi:hypothetical protein
MASRSGVIRLDALTLSDPAAIEVRHNGVLVLTSTETKAVADKLSELGVHNPQPLVNAVLHFDAVEIDQSKAGAR